MDEEQKYLFDLFGFIVMRDVLTQEQILKLRSTSEQRSARDVRSQ